MPSSFPLISSFHHPSSTFVVLSDSLSAITSLQSLTPSHPVVTQIQEWLFRLSTRKKSVQLCWVSGHVGIPGNERADSLASSAALTPGNPPHPVPAVDCFPALASLFGDLWPLLASPWAIPGSPTVTSCAATLHPSAPAVTAL